MQEESRSARSRGKWKDISGWTDTRSLYVCDDGAQIRIPCEPPEQACREPSFGEEGQKEHARTGYTQRDAYKRSGIVYAVRDVND